MHLFMASLRLLTAVLRRLHHAWNDVSFATVFSLLPLMGSHIHEKFSFAHQH